MILQKSVEISEHLFYLAQQTIYNKLYRIYKLYTQILFDVLLASYNNKK
ncbi:hypothetical protein FM107_08835 [Sphingobacterium sp. JB170]|nr:hypothetical protein FM107_08835 [Sphingobacterium sp. JB170]